MTTENTDGSESFPNIFKSFSNAEIQKYFRWFLVQMKSLEFAFEIN